MTTPQTLADLLHEAAETHHVVYRIVDGDDPDWASWYADWLLDLSELPELIGAKPVRSHLVHALVQLDRDYTPPLPASGGRTGTRRGLPATRRRARPRSSRAGPASASGRSGDISALLCR